VSGRRLAALVVLVAAVVAGTAIDRMPRRQPQRVADYWLLVGDFHVHAFPGDGALTPWSLRDQAARLGVDVIAITNHNQTFTGRLADVISRASDGPILIGGEEVTSPDYHLIALGIQRVVSGNQPAASAIQAIHAQGGVAIAAHPNPQTRGWDAPAIERLDGAEIAHPIDRPEEQEGYSAFFTGARARSPRLAPIGSSDVHITPGIARCRTIVFARERTPAGVLDAIRNGRTVAVDESGHLHGDPEWMALAASAAPLPGDTTRMWRALSTTIAIAGVIAMLVFA
jgi:predicted metal-dependent phosphoesterase TrpH